MKNLNNKFLMLNKPYFDKGLKRLDILILAQIQECNMNKSQCCFTNQQLSELFGKDESTIKKL